LAVVAFPVIWVELAFAHAGLPVAAGVKTIEKLPSLLASTDVMVPP